MIKNFEGEGWLGWFYFTQIGDDNKWELSFECFSAGTVALNEYGMLAIDFTKATRWETTMLQDVVAAMEALEEQLEKVKSAPTASK
jgi:hypothetical protein